MYALNYRPGPMWEPEYVTEIMGPQRYRVKLLKEYQLWYRHQNQLCYCHVEDDNTQSAKIMDATRVFPISRDSPSVFPQHEESAEDAETTVLKTTLAAGEGLRGTRRYPLQES